MGRIRRRGTAFSALAVTIGVTGAIGWTGAGSAAAQSCLSINGTNIAGTPADCDSSAASSCCKRRSVGLSAGLHMTHRLQPKIIEEMMLFRRSERENRVIDHDQEGSMEIKKREGYF